VYRIIAYDSPTETTGHVVFDPRINHYISDGKLELLESEIDRLTLTVNQANYLFGNVRPMQTHAEVYQDNNLLFRGRALDVTRQMKDNGQFLQTFTFESIQNYLQDTSQRWAKVQNTTPKQFFQRLIDTHNSQVPDYKKFTVRNVDVTNSTDNVYRYIEDGATTWDTIKDKLVSRLGGYIRVEYLNGINYIDYVQNPGKDHTDDTPIKIGKNLQAASVQIDPTEVITQLVPLGATIEQSETSPDLDTQVSQPRIDIRSVNGGRDYLDISDLQQEFGIIRKSVQWDDVHEPAILLTKAKNWIAAQSSSKESWTVDALELPEFNSFRISDRYSFIQPNITIPKMLRIAGKTIDFGNWNKSTLTIADKQVSLSSYQLENRKAAEVVKQLRATVSTQNGQIITLNNKNKEMQTAVTAQQETIDKLQADIDNADLAGIADLKNLVKELQDQINSDNYYTGSIIDVSEFQGSINWSQVVSGGLALSVIRIQSGSSHIDETYTANIPNAISAGANYAVYAYFSALDANDAEIEARDFYNRATSAIGSRKQPRFWMIDVEKNSVTSGTLSAAVTAYMSKLNALGIPDNKIVIYVSNALYPSINTSRTQIWIPSYGINDGTIANSRKPLYPYDLWQYTSKGHISGISTNVDMSTEPSDRFKKAYLTKG
jgi:GH25 family lysozyme M1 (1,4-beta-N-acetylmuramidase)